MRFCRVIVVLLCFVGGKGHSADETDEFFKGAKQKIIEYSGKLPRILSKRGVVFTVLLTEEDCSKLEFTVQSVKSLREKLTFSEVYDQSQHTYKELGTVLSLLDFLDDLSSKIVGFNKKRIRGLSLFEK